MKKITLFSAVLIFFMSCDNSSGSSDAGKTDSTGLTNPVSIDTVKHPSGMDNSSVISTDTAAMNVQNSIKKADSVKAQNKK